MSARLAVVLAGSTPSFLQTPCEVPRHWDHNTAGFAGEAPFAPFSASSRQSVHLDPSAEQCCRCRQKGGCSSSAAAGGPVERMPGATTRGAAQGAATQPEVPRSAPATRSSTTPLTANAFPPSRDLGSPQGQKRPHRAFGCVESTAADDCRCTSPATGRSLDQGSYARHILWTPGAAFTAKVGAPRNCRGAEASQKKAAAVESGFEEGAHSARTSAAAQDNATRAAG